MDARNLLRPVTRRPMRSRGMLLQLPPRPATDARLTRFTTLLDTLTAGESALEAAHALVERGNAAQAERELTQFIVAAQPVLEHSRDLPAEYVDLLGQRLARCLVARAGAWVEQALASELDAEALMRAARADMASVNALPTTWLDHKTRMALTRLQHVLEPAAA
jgi:hypothetical protein